VSPATGKSSGTAQQLSVTVGKNSSLDRNATITVKSIDGTLSGTVAVTQTAYMPTEINDITAKNAAAVSNPYKYQKYRLSGTVKGLQGNGSFNLIDDSGSLPVAGLNASDAGYGKQGGALSNVKERDNVTVVGYLEQVGGKMTLVYAYLEKVDSYVEPDPSTAATKSFPYTVDYTAADGGVVINNPTFPLALRCYLDSLQLYRLAGFRLHGRHKLHDRVLALHRESEPFRRQEAYPRIRPHREEFQRHRDCEGSDLCLDQRGWRQIPETRRFHSPTLTSKDLPS
jgi:hypothetical protein